MSAKFVADPSGIFRLPSVRLRLTGDPLGTLWPPA
jgi:hypothetical protein